MITQGEVDKLRSIRAPDESVLSLYARVPFDPAGLGELPARVGDLIDGADAGPHLAPDDERAARDVVAARARNWLGHTLGVFACADLGLLEVVPLPGGFAERAVVGVRPHLRPLLAALQRYPDHRVVIIDGRHVWLLAVSGDQIDTVASAADSDVTDARFGGWYGLEPSGVNQRVSELTRLDYQAAAAILGREVRHGGPQPLVIGGPADSVKHLLADLPGEVRDCYAGCFAADLRELTASRARDLAAPVLAHRSDRRERRLVEQITRPAAGIRAAIGLHACLAAVNADEASLLLIPDEGMVRGYYCERCDAISLASDGCCDWGAASRAVPDLLEEMALRTLRDGGDVISARELRCGAAARLR